MSETKTCQSTRYHVGCNEAKPIGAFFHGGKSGYSTQEFSYCKDCRDLGSHLPQYRLKFIGAPPKECPACRAVLPAYDFGKDSRQPDGLHLRCKRCVAAKRISRGSVSTGLPEGIRRCSRCRTIFEGSSGFCSPCKRQYDKERRVANPSRRCRNCHIAHDKSAFESHTANLCSLCEAVVAEIRRVKRLVAKYASEGNRRTEGILSAAAKSTESAIRSLGRAAALSVKAAELTSGQKLCLGTKKKPGCGIIKPLKSFGMIKRDPTRRKNRCHTCAARTRDKLARKAARLRARKRNPGKFHARKRLREVRKLQALPKWLSLAQRREIFKIYEERARISQSTGVLHHVDHIIPLRGREEVSGHVVEVWGLHVPWNLRVIPAKENEDKSNKFLDISQAIRNADLKIAA